VQADQRAPDNQTGRVQTLYTEERRKLTERERGKNSAKKYQAAQPDTEREINQRVKKGSHLGVSMLHRTAASEPLNPPGHRWVGGKQIGQAGPTQQGSNDKQVSGRGRSRHRQAPGIGVEFL